MTEFPPLELKVWGEFACFTRPEMKVERVSYDVMTPSAARGILEAIFWKPEFDWRIREIEVLKPVRRMSILRNEVKSKIAARTVKGWAKGERREAYLANEDRTQRHALILRDVAYIIRADQVVRPGAGHPAKYRDQFRRRLDRGQCFWRPYLGCREFSAYFSKPTGLEESLTGRQELGRMLFDLIYEEKGKSAGQGEPVFFRGVLEDGVMRVPDELYEQIARAKEVR
jgi:CRISPR-associated protein Cas5d